MLGRLALRAMLWGLRRYLGGPAKSWLLSTLVVLGFRAARSVVGRKELVEIISVRKGDHIELDQLKISHRKQLKNDRRRRRSERRT